MSAPRSASTASGSQEVGRTTVRPRPGFELPARAQHEHVFRIGGRYARPEFVLEQRDEPVGKRDGLQVARALQQVADGMAGAHPIQPGFGIVRGAVPRKNQRHQRAGLTDITDFNTLRFWEIHERPVIFPGPRVRVVGHLRRVAR